VITSLVRKERRLKRRDAALAVAFPMALLLLWEIVSRAGLVNPILFPPPTRIAQTGWELLVEGVLFANFSASLMRIAFGYTIGAVFGITFGLFMGYFRAVGAATSPTLYALYSVPKIAILPLLLVIFGLGETTKIVIVAIPTFFVLAINAMGGVRNLGGGIIEAGRSYGAEGWKLFRYVILPGSLPSIFTGLRVATGLAVTVIIAAEFVAANEGLGYMIWNAWTIFQPERMYVGIVSVALLGAAFSGVISVLERLALPWRNAARRP
jgi:ABC-type nitrate/sulfonate/bicarbonate transport system permease component